jgi:hypothetical protein
MKLIDSNNKCQGGGGPIGKLSEGCASPAIDCANYWGIWHLEDQYMLTYDERSTYCLAVYPSSRVSRISLSPLDV